MGSEFKIRKEIDALKKEITLHQKVLNNKQIKMQALLKTADESNIVKRGKLGKRVSCGTFTKSFIADKIQPDVRYKAACHIITDHALLRYLDREMGWDVEELRDDMVHKYALKGVVNSGAKQYKRDGLVFIIDNGVVITVKKG